MCPDPPESLTIDELHLTFENFAQKYSDQVQKLMNDLSVNASDPNLEALRTIAVTIHLEMRNLALVSRGLQYQGSLLIIGAGRQRLEKIREKMEVFGMDLESLCEPYREFLASYQELVVSGKDLEAEVKELATETADLKNDMKTATEKQEGACAGDDAKE